MKNNNVYPCYLYLTVDEYRAMLELAHRYMKEFGDCNALGALIQSADYKLYEQMECLYPYRLEGV